MNEIKANVDAAAPVASNVINDALPDGGGLSMVVVSNNKTNEAQSAVGAAAPQKVATPNALEAGATVYALSAEDTSNAPEVESHQLC